MSKITVTQARVLAKKLIHELRCVATVEAVDLLSDSKRLMAVLLNISDGPEPLDEEEVDVQAAELKYKNRQTEQVREAVLAWMHEVYSVAPSLDDGNCMELKITAGCVGSHPYSDFDLFSFKLESIKPVGDF